MGKQAMSAKPDRDKGSYRHVLDLVSASNFREIIDGLLTGTNSRLADVDHRHPSGRSKKQDWTEVELEDFLKRHQLPDYAGLDRKWWIAFKGNRPTWDLICQLEINGNPGLLLVEAKAHHAEMCETNKKGKVDKENDRSIANDLSIRLRLAETSLALGDLGLSRFHLSADHDYQLSNRLAYLHKLASDGIPTVLLYLGWTGSPDWPYDPFIDDSAWRDAMKGHFERVGPWEFVESKHRMKSGSPFQMIVRPICPSVINSSSGSTMPVRFQS